MDSQQFWRPNAPSNKTFVRTTKEIDRDPSLNERVPVVNRYKHLSLSQQRLQLPIARYKTEVLYLLEKYKTIVLIGETGSGKSTQLPQYLHESGWTNENLSIVCTQPRRMAAVTVAKRVAEEVGCMIGDTVGYGVRFDYQCSTRTRIKYYTDGVLLRETLTDPLLSKYSVIIVDEAHQRSLHSDILMGLLKKIQKRRPTLRVIICSATLNAMSMKLFFEGNKLSATNPEDDTACILSVQGRQFPVDVLYLSDPVHNYLRCCADTVLAIHKYEDWGDVLVFLPGGEDIDSLVHLLEDEYTGGSMYFLPLYSSLPIDMQMRCFDPTPSNMRKVVIATNIAEASVTIEGVKFVVDSGFVKLNYFDVRSGVNSLITCPITKSAAEQRAGRAGRTQQGKCFRLMTEEFYMNELEDYPPADMQRTDISWAVLQLKALGIDDILHFDFLSPPPTESMIFALEILFSLGAIDEKCQLTSLGEKMAEMPIEPRLAKCLLASFDFGCGEELLTIAAMCSVQYPFITVKSKTNQEAIKRLQESIEEFAVHDSDHLTLLRIYEEFQISGYQQSWCDSNCLQHRILSRVKEVRGNLSGMLSAFKPKGAVIASCGTDGSCVKKCLITGYFSHVAKLGNDGNYHTLRGSVLVTPHPTSVLAQFGAPPEWVMFNEISHISNAYMREVSRIDPYWLLEYAKHYYTLTNTK